METQKSETLPLLKADHVILACRAVRQYTIALKFGLFEQTKIVTAASELARNALIHGCGGAMRIEVLRDGFRIGLRLIFEDQGPGIPDIELAIIQTKVGSGTRVTVAKWK